MRASDQSIDRPPAYLSLTCQSSGLQGKVDSAAEGAARAGTRPGTGVQYKIGRGILVQVASVRVRYSTVSIVLYHTVLYTVVQYRK